jgi:hypothetical protein
MRILVIVSFSFAAALLAAAYLPWDGWQLYAAAAVLLAAVLFLISLFHVPGKYVLKAIAYFLGAAAYFSEILLLTDCFRTKVPHQEMFMAYCFGPMYLLLGLSYLLGH